MTHEEIKEYVDNTLNEWCTENLQIVEPWNEVVADLSYIVVSAIQKLSKDYCIVPKEQVYMRLGVANALMEQDPARREFYRGQSSAIVSIFGKDMFEEEGK